jgi:prophage antirepressor-like protein/predicted GIY-YIG superfamily endonuclease
MENKFNEITEKYKIEKKNGLYSLDDIAKNIAKTNLIYETYPKAAKIDNKKYIIMEEFKNIIFKSQTNEAYECKKILMINNNLNKLFSFEGNDIVWIIHDDTIWTIGNNIAKILDYEDPNRSIRQIINKINKKSLEQILISAPAESAGEEIIKNKKSAPEESSRAEIKNIVGSISKKTIFINEAGLYELILYSKKDIAKRFRTWLTTEVLPAITRTGKYDIATSSNEFAIKLKKEIIDYNDYIGKNVLYIIKIDNNLFKYGITSNLIKRIEQHTNTFKIIDCIKIFVLNTEQECREIETSIRRISKQLKINKTYNNQTEIFEPTECYTIDYILKKIDTYIENQKINRKVDNNLLIAQEETKKELIKVNLQYLELLKNNIITKQEFNDMLHNFNLSIMNNDQIKQQTIEYIPKKKENNIIKYNDDDFIDIIDDDIELQDIDNIQKKSNLIINKPIKEEKELIIDNNDLIENKKTEKKRKCISCDNMVNRNSIKCVYCTYRQQIIDSVNNRDRPTYKTLKKELETSNYTAVGKHYDKNPNTIRKWIVYYEKYNLTDYEGEKINNKK